VIGARSARICGTVSDCEQYDRAVELTRI
jgi:hypothetical protein